MAVRNDLLKMKQYFETGVTKSYSFRKDQLTRLKQTVIKHQILIQNALYKDLKKSPEETWVTETGFLLSEISYSLNHLNKWMKPESVSTNLLNIPSKSYICN